MPSPIDDLPMAAKRNEFLKLVDSNQITVLTAPTGSGKSTVGPLTLLEHGYRVLVTQPRRIAAMTLADWVAKCANTTLGGRVGFRHALAHAESLETQLLYCTDGLQVVRELMRTRRAYDVVVVDELHEGNLNMEILLAWFRRELRRGAPFKLVVQSATINKPPLMKYLGNPASLDVEGRSFPITMRARSGNRIADAAEMIREGINPLVFEAGKREIRVAMAQMARMRTKAKILPLHGDLTPAEQLACFRYYPQGMCVFATNVAESAVTLPYINGVIDSGWERRAEVRHGVEGLYLRPCSRASHRQRIGRAGRVGPGVAIDDYDGEELQPEYSVPEIQRVRLDKAILQLAEAGVPIEEMEFLHAPVSGEVRSGKRRLFAMGAMTPPTSVTPLGSRIARLPVAASIGRMLIEAERRGVLQDMVEIAALLEGGSIINRENDAWRELCEGEHDSDLLAQLRIFRAARKMQGDEERADAGVHVRNYQRALDVLHNLEKSLQPWFAEQVSTGQREAILLSICSGMLERVYEQSAEGYYGGEGFDRKAGDDSVVDGAPWVVGVPFDLSLRGGDDGEERVLHLLTRMTRLEPHWLQELVPDQVDVTRVPDSEYYDPHRDRVLVRGTVRFRGIALTGHLVSDDDDRNVAALAGWLAEVTTNTQRWSNKTITRHTWPGPLKSLLLTNRAIATRAGWNVKQVTRMYRELLAGRSRLNELSDPSELTLQAGGGEE